MLNVNRIARGQLQTEPFEWATIDGLFAPKDARALAETYPSDHFKTVSGHGGEKDYDYEARALIKLGERAISDADDLSPAWLQLAQDLVSPAYRTAMSTLSGRDLASAPVEVNVFHYGPGHLLGPHPDLPDKVTTHVLYFNRTWDAADGGCLRILRSRDAADPVAEILPVVGNSAVLVRADHSWHAVSRVVDSSGKSRRSVTVTFYRPGSTSSMWPPDDTTPLHHYDAPDLDAETARPATAWARLRRFVSRR